MLNASKRLPASRTRKALKRVMEVGPLQAIVLPGNGVHQQKQLSTGLETETGAGWPVGYLTG